MISLFVKIFKYKETPAIINDKWFQRTFLNKIIKLYFPNETLYEKCTLCENDICFDDHSIY